MCKRNKKNTIFLDIYIKRMYYKSSLGKGDYIMGLMFLDNTIKLYVCKEETLFIFQIARLVIRFLQIAVPFALIIWGSLDFFKAVVAGDDKEIKQKRKPFVQRLIAAIIILLLPMLVDIIMKTIASNTETDFATCWTEADPKNGIILPDPGDVN